MRLPLLAVLACMGGCASPPGPDDLIDARWMLKPGDELSIRIQSEQRGISRGSMEVEGIFRVRESAPDGSFRGTLDFVRFVVESEGDRPMKLVVERGAVVEAQGLDEEQRRSMVAKIGKPTESTLSPTGMLAPVSPNDSATFAGWPLGVSLPGRKIRGAQSWTGEIRAAHCDALETEYRFETAGERMRITGRSTPKAEENHRIRVRAEGTFRPEEGIVEEGRLDISFSPLGMVLRTTVRFAISRR